MATPPFSQSDQAPLLRVFRRSAARADQRADRDAAITPEGWAETVVENINELAFLLTGYRKFYHLKPHATSWMSPSSPPPNNGEPG